MPKKLTTEEFIARARAIHGDKYDYSQVKYSSCNGKVIILCPKHGPFLQTPQSHLAGHGCAGCSGRGGGSRDRNKNKQKFKDRVKETHGENLDVQYFIYKNCNEKGVVICKDCGFKFQRRASDLYLRSYGCPMCHNGFAKDSGVYLIKSVDNLKMKIGMSKDVGKRLAQLRCGYKKGVRTPFEVVLVSYHALGGKAYGVEKELHKIFASKNLHLTGFDGATEWFEYDESAEKILGMIAGLINARSYNKK